MFSISSRSMVTDVRLAMLPAVCRHALGKRTREKGPSVLVSYPFLSDFQSLRGELYFRSWVLDSGAFTAVTQGLDIDLVQFTETACALAESDEKLEEVFALDVVGDWKATLRNCEYMWKRGVQAIPTFHRGSPWEALTEISDCSDKIAIGGIGARGLSQQQRREFIDQCFARVWPKKIHGFAVGSRRLIMSYPFHSVDASSWTLNAMKFGHWQAYGNKALGRGLSSHDLAVQMDYYLGIEDDAKRRWGRELRKL